MIPPIISNTELTLHCLRLWGLLLLTKVDFVVSLSRHAASNAAEGHIGNAIDNVDASSLSIPIEANANAAEDYRKAHQTVGTADETDIVFVETKAVLVSNEHGVGTGRKAGATACL